jgi:hypothetical protein
MYTRSTCLQRAQTCPQWSMTRGSINMHVHKLNTSTMNKEGKFCAARTLDSKDANWSKMSSFCIHTLACSFASLEMFACSWFMHTHTNDYTYSHRYNPGTKKSLALFSCRCWKLPYPCIKISYMSLICIHWPYVRVQVPLHAHACRRLAHPRTQGSHFTHHRVCPCKHMSYIHKKKKKGMTR